MLFSVRVSASETSQCVSSPPPLPHTPAFNSAGGGALPRCSPPQTLALWSARGGVCFFFLVVGLCHVCCLLCCFCFFVFVGGGVGFVGAIFFSKGCFCAIFFSIWCLDLLSFDGIDSDPVGAGCSCAIFLSLGCFCATFLLIWFSQFSEF